MTPENKDDELMLENELRVSDLMNGGAQFTLRSNLQEHDEDDELFDESLNGKEEITLDDDVIVSPWDKPFAELIPLMQDIGHRVYKKVVRKPVDNVEMLGRSRVTIHYNAYMENETKPYDSTYLRGSPLTFVTHEAAVLDGLEYAVRSMKRGEESQFVIPYELLYGKMGCEPRIKKEADILFVIQLFKFSKIGDAEATEKGVDVEDRTKYQVMIGKILEVKESGMDAFRQGSYIKAAAAFHKAINRLEMCRLANEEEQKEQEEHLIKLYVNVMTSYNKMDNPKKACSAFNDLKRLTDVNKNPKALFQHGKALLALGEFKRSKEALKKANELLPGNKDITHQLATLNTKFNDYKNTESSLWRKAFRNDDTPSAQATYEVGDDFKEFVKDIVTKFKDDPKQSRLPMPLGLSQAENDYITDSVKDMNMKLVYDNVHGQNSCHLTKK